MLTVYWCANQKTKKKFCYLQTNRDLQHKNIKVSTPANFGYLKLWNKDRGMYSD